MNRMLFLLFFCMLYSLAVAQDNVYTPIHKDMSAKDKLKVKIGYKKMRKAREKDRAKRDYKKMHTKRYGKRLRRKKFLFFFI